MALRARAPFLSVPVPILVSLFLHASAAASLVVVAGGHARAGSTEISIVEIDTLPPEPAPVSPDRVEEVEEAKPELKAAGVPHDHTHAYPVPPSHDARPHDPSLHHDHDESHLSPAPRAPEAAQPAPAVTSDAPLPRFTIAIGTSRATATGPHVAGDANGTGQGNGVAPAPPSASPEVTLPASAVQVPARLVTSATAAYPAGARADEIEGDVGLEIVVDGEGRVVDARVVRSGGHGFDESALVAIRRYRFSPAQQGGRAVRVRMPWTVQFRLR